MQITKLSFLSTQPLGDNVFAVEEILDIPIEQVFGTHKSRGKAFVNLIESDAVQKVSRDTWKIVKDITLDAANVTMRQGDFFRVRLDEQGDDSPIHFDLDATGVFVLNRDVFASLQTYEILAPGAEQRVRMQFTFGGRPVVDARLTSKFASMSLEPVDASNGIYEIVLFTSMRPSDDYLPIEITGNSLNNTVFEAPLHITVREPVLTVVPINLQINSRQTKTLSWKLLMEGLPAEGLAVKASADDHIKSVNSFKTDGESYFANLTAEDEIGATKLTTVYDFGYPATVVIDLSVISAPAVFIDQDTLILEANQEQLIRFYVRQDTVPVPNAKYSTTDIRGPGIFSVSPELVTLDAAAGYYAYRVTTNHKGGPISVRTNLTISGTPYPVFFDLTSKSTPVEIIPLSVLPAADTAYMQFRIQQQRLGGLTPLVGVVAKVFTVTGTPVVGVQGSVSAVGQGVYQLKVVTNDLGGSANVNATLTIEGEDFDVAFATPVLALSLVVAKTGQDLTGEISQAVPVEFRLDGVLFDITEPVVTVTGTSLISYGSLRRTGVGKYEILAVDVNGKGGVLNIRVNAKVRGFSQVILTSVAVTSVSAVLASNITHYRPTTQGPLQFTALRDGVVQPLTFSNATLTGAASYTPTVEVIDASAGRYQVKNVVAPAPAGQQPIGVSAPYKLRGYSYTLNFNSYTEAMKTLTVDTSVVVEGGKKTDYALKFFIDGVEKPVESSNLTGSGSAFVSMDSPSLVNGSIKGLLTTDTRGQVSVTGTVMIDGIIYPANIPIRVKDAAPALIVSVPDLEAEKSQAVFFTLSNKGVPIGDATLSNGVVTGQAIEGYNGFALHNAGTGEYRFNVITNGLGGEAVVTVDLTIDGDVYPTTLTVNVKTGKAWGISSGSTLLAGTVQNANFSITQDGTVISEPYLRNLNLQGSTLKSALKDIQQLNTSVYRSNNILLAAGAGVVTMSLEASSNQVNWHALTFDFPVAEAVAPTTAIGPMIPANATSILTFTVRRYGAALATPTLSNLTVAGAPVASASLDIIKLANGSYGTTITTNELGGDIAVSFSVNDDGVIYPITLTGSADIVRPWTATLLSSPVPETATNVDVQSFYGGNPETLTVPKATVIGESVVAPVGEVAMIYQDGANKIYRIPGVIVNNDGGPVTVSISGQVYNNDVSTVLQANIVPLPELTLTPTTTELPFQATTNIQFTVQRGASPSVFSASDVKNLTVTSPAISSFTPTVTPVGDAYRIPVVTNGLGGAVDVSFTVTLAGVDYPLSFSITAQVEPPVSANSLIAIESNTTGTNLDFQLVRGVTACADPFVVKTVSINSRSITSYPQSVINVDVAAGHYRMQVNTSAYSDPISVTITATVRGENVTLTFPVSIKAGVLPTVTLTADNFTQNLMSSCTLSFKQGATVITGVTLGSVEGDLTQATLSGTTLSGVPTVGGAQPLTVNYIWKGATYTGVVTITPSLSTIVTPITDPKLKAYSLNAVNFEMKQLDGSAYPGTTTFAVSSPFTVTTPLTKQPDGTYSIGLTGAGEAASTAVIITATNGPSVVKHIMYLTVWLNLEARFSGTTLLDSTQVSNMVQFDVYEKNQGGVFQIYGTTDLNSLSVHSVNPDDLVGFASFSISATTRYRGTFTVSTLPVDLSDMTYTFYWTSPLGRVYQINGIFRVQKPILAEWVPVNLEGGAQATIQFYLKSGILPITNAIDSLTTVTNATIKRAPYAIDAATGLYAIDVQPSGNATTMSITLKVKQTINNLTSTLTANAFTVTPGAYAAVPTLTLKRQVDFQNLEMQFTQGGIPLSGVTINSVTFDGAITLMNSPTVILGGTTYRWQAKASIDGATPHLVFNITVSGVGMILEVDYPIAAPVEPALSFYDPFTMVKGQPVTIKWALTLGETLYDNGIYFTPIISETSELKVQSQVSAIDSGESRYSMHAQVIPKVAGTAVVMHMLVTYNGVTYNAKFVADVMDSAIVDFQDTSDVLVGVTSTRTFTLTPPVGVTIDPTAIPVFTTTPFAAGAVTTNGDGTWNIPFTPTKEVINSSSFIGTIVSGGVTYKIGGRQGFNAPFRLAWGVDDVTNHPMESAGSTIYSYNNRFVDAVTGNAYSLSTGYVTISNLTVTADVDAINTASAPGMSSTNTTGYRFYQNTKKVDFANLLFKMDVTTDVGGVYRDLTVKAIAHDAVVWEYIPSAPGFIGMKQDVKFKLTWQTSGNPVTNAVFKLNHTMSGGTAEASLKVVDAENGIYAATVTSNALSTTITPRAGFMVDAARNVLCYTAITGPATVLTQLNPVTVTQPFVTGMLRTPSPGIIPQNVFFKANPGTGLAQDGWILTQVAAMSLSSLWTGSVAADVDGLYKVPMRSITYASMPSNASPYSQSTMSVTFTKGVDTLVLSVPVTFYIGTSPIESIGPVTTAGGMIELTMLPGLNSYYTLDPGFLINADLYGPRGETVIGIVGESTNNVDRRIRLNLPAGVPIKDAIILVHLYGGGGTYLHMVTGNFDVVSIEGTTITGETQ